MSSLYRRLSSAGLSRKFVRETVLPSWWEDAAAETPAGYSQALIYLSRHAGIDLASLRDPSGDITPNPVPCRLKARRQGASGSDNAFSRSVAIQVATLAAIASKTPAPFQLPAATAIRSEILRGGAPWVDLVHLVDWSWRAGIPVVPVSGLPGRKGMDGLSARSGDHTAVAICSDRKSSAWLLFILAHELGHVALGHLRESMPVVVDEDVRHSDADPDERAANRFACELLAGRPDLAVSAPGRWPDATTLAREALRIGESEQIDPGHVVLNYAYSMGPTFFAVANAALQRLSPSDDGRAILRKKLADSLEWSQLPADAAEFLARMTGIAAVPAA
jgi:Zn-dependent peptidase ImmA (M78 family)